MANRPRTPRGERVLRKEDLVPAPVAAVWWAWTTSEGMASWWATSSWIELRRDGPFEVYFLKRNPRGWQGSEGCRILSYVPQEMLSFTWNFPPSIPEIRDEHTWVVLRFVAVTPRETRVALDELGWRSGAAWAKGWAYFDAAWSSVLRRLRDRAPRIASAYRKRQT